MQRILHINDYPADTGGGTEVIMKRTIELLQERGFVAESLTVADLPDGRRTPRRFLDNPEARTAVAARLASFVPHVVHLHNYYHVLSPGILAELARARQQRQFKVVMTAHDCHLVCPNSGGNWFRMLSGSRKIFEGAHMARPDYLLTRSWDHRGVLYSGLKLLQHVWSYRWKKLHRVIDLVICPSRFIEQLISRTELPCCWLPHPVPAKIGHSNLTTRLNQREGGLRLVFAGRVEPEKGLNEFLKLWPEDFHADLTVIGTGGDLERCRRTCAARGLSDCVRFLGWLTHEQTMAEIAESHVLVLPSRFLESYGLVLIEALASGTNVLAADIGALREIVEAAGVGFIFELDNPDSLRTQLCRIQSCHEEGTLNHFDLTQFLDERSETRYMDRLLRAYGLDPSSCESSRCA